jgi:hypothetical protein
VHLVGFYYKKFVKMHGHMNVKYDASYLRYLDMFIIMILSGTSEFIANCCHFSVHVSYELSLRQGVGNYIWYIVKSYCIPPVLFRLIVAQSR